MTLILGNILSLCAVICLAISVLKKNKRRLIYWQILDTGFFIASTFVLASYSAVVTNSVSLIRNLLAFKNRLNLNWVIFFCVIMTVLGLYFNNRGVIGWLLIMASVEYTICLMITRNVQQMRYALIVNLSFWLVHDAVIQSYPAALNDLTLGIWTAVQVWRNRK